MPDTEDTPATIVVVAQDGSELLLGDVGARPPDVGLIDRLLRLHLEARRRGCRLEVRGATAALAVLAELLGLSGVLALEPGREAELGEQLGIQEVMEPRDPPA